MGFLKAKYCVPFFMLVLLTSGVPLNANNDGEILPTANAAVGTPEVNKTSIKKGTQYLALRNPIVIF